MSANGKVYSGEVYWPVLYHVRYDIEAKSPKAALAKLKEAMENDQDMDNPERCFFEMAEGCADSDGSNSISIWDESRSRILLEEPSDEERFARNGPAMVKALAMARERIRFLERALHGAVQTTRASKAIKAALEANGYEIVKGA
jgi:hypothetical protein